MPLTPARVWQAVNDVEHAKRNAAGRHVRCRPAIA
jgi:hypothetical protein